MLMNVEGADCLLLVRTAAPIQDTPGSSYSAWTMVKRL